MDIFYIILAIIAIMVVLLLILIATRPSEFRIERSTSIQSSPETIYPHIHNVKLMNEWSPWAKIDPEIKMTYSDKLTGPGAFYQWIGNKKVGEGKVTVLEESLNQSVAMRIDFLRPFKCTNNADYSLTRDGPQTRMTWGMTGKLNFIMKLMGMFMSMDAMVGKDFEKGLNNLKAIVEK
jgi:hypothetical protein